MPLLPDFYEAAINHPAVSGLLAAILLLLIATRLFTRSRPWQYLRRSPILTPNEREFYHRLTRALPRHLVFCQVSLSALIDVDSRLSDRQRFAIRRRFAWKYVDFVVCEPYTLDALLIIELDDRTHVARADRERDAITKAAGYQTLRFQSRNKPSVSDLAELFAKLLPTLKPPPTG